MKPNELEIRAWRMTAHMGREMEFDYGMFKDGLEAAEEEELTGVAKDRWSIAFAADHAYLLVYKPSELEKAQAGYSIKHLELPLDFNIGDFLWENDFEPDVVYQCPMGIENSREAVKSLKMFFDIMLNRLQVYQVHVGDDSIWFDTPNIWAVGEFARLQKEVFNSFEEPLDEGVWTLYHLDTTKGTLQILPKGA